MIFYKLMQQMPLNTTNRQVLLNNKKFLCPEISTNLWYRYARPVRFCVSGGAEIASAEERVRGYDHYRGIYTLGILQLMTEILQ